jgi:light-regulated signal transduction histidine kinase (bacteriophytochrome)
MTESVETPVERERRVEAMKRVARVAMHEVRNVLNPIVSAAYLLDANAGDATKVRELAKRIETFARADERVAAKLRELLEHETAGSGVPATAGAEPPAVTQSTEK